MILVIDNYDSFTFNLVQYFQELGQTVEVFRNDSISLEEVEKLDPEAIVISPGPGGPEEAGISLELIRHFAGIVPIFGVCLGHQSIGSAFGARVIEADRLMHGKTSPIFTTGTGLFNEMSIPFQACRYHSLIVEEQSLPETLEITAVSDEGEIMGLKHRDLPIYGVQFHPESILTDQGKRILENFLSLASRFNRGQYRVSRKCEPSGHKSACM